MAAFGADPFGSEWVEEVVALSAGREPIPGMTGVVALGIGSKVDTTNAHVFLSITDGIADGSTSNTPDVTLPFTKRQVERWLEGELVLTEAYMKGDIKPVGASGPLFAALELLDWLASGA